VCGDGFIDAGEQCDDANDVPTDGCDGCMVVCNGPNEVLDPATLNCYLHDALASGSWSTVRSSCLSWGGDLAAISSAAEQSFVQTFLATSSWIGGTDSVAEGTFGWTNGEAFAYTNWNPGEPNDTDANEDCIEIYGPGIATAAFLWNDLLCDTVKPAVCERAPPGI
jgi:cysteine-rich repeat protein